jgi:hypothetical protein
MFLRGCPTLRSQFCSTAATDFDSVIHHTHAGLCCYDVILKATAEWNTALAENDVGAQSRVFLISIAKLQHFRCYVNLFNLSV